MDKSVDIAILFFFLQKEHIIDAYFYRIWVNFT